MKNLLLRRLFCTTLYEVLRYLFSPIFFISSYSYSLISDFINSSIIIKKKSILFNALLLLFATLLYSLNIIMIGFNRTEYLKLIDKEMRSRRRFKSVDGVAK